MNIFTHFKTNIFAKDILNKPSFVLLVYFATSALKNLSLFFGKYIFFDRVHHAVPQNLYL